MPDKPLPPNRALSEAEADEFRALGLTAGNWIALAPLPLFGGDLHLPYPDDLLTLHKLQTPLRTEAAREADAARAPEAEALWKKLCRRGVRPEDIDAGTALLSWFLATRLPRLPREAYLVVIDNTAYRFQKASRVGAPIADPSFTVRQRFERYFPHSTYTRHPGDPKVDAPRPEQVAELFGADLWKQMLAAPIAAAMAEQHVRPGAVASLLADLAHVTLPSAYNKPQVLETHLASGSWRRLFTGLLDPGRRSETTPVIDAGLRIAATGLASVSFATREMLLKTIHEQISRGIDRADARRVTADEWIVRVREMIEDVIRQAAPVTTPPPPPPPTPASPPVAIPARSTESAPTAPSPAVSAGSKAPPSPQPSVAGAKAPPSPQPSVAGAKAPPQSPPLSVAGAKAPPQSPPQAVPPPPPLRPTVAVERAEPFTMVTFDGALARARQTTVAAVRAWMSNPERPCLLFDDARSECSEIAIVRDAARVPQQLWLVGDLHADVLTLANLIAHAERVAQDGALPAFVFLGDFVDRGRHDHETLLLLFQLVLRDPSRVCIIPGNHDIDLQWDERSDRFRVTIEPAEYCEDLNQLIRSNDPAAGERVELAKLAIEFWKTRPKAVILPDGALLAHAGFPHADMQPLLKTPADLAKAPCLSDFLWARISETARKRPNRGNRGHEFGWETFAQFCKTSAQIGVPPVKRFIRGHDHVPHRWQSYPDYENAVLTINAMGRRMDGESEPADGPHPFPVMARYAANQLPVVVRLPLDAREVDRAFGRGEAGTESASDKTDSSLPENDAESRPGDSSADRINGVTGGVRLEPPNSDAKRVEP